MSGIQKQGGQKSTRRLEDAIASLHALERQSALLHTQSSMQQQQQQQQQRSLSPRPAEQQQDLASMRQRMAEMEQRARGKAQLRAAQSKSVPEGVPEAGRKKQAQESAEMQVAKKTMLAALTAGTTSAGDLEAAVAGLKKALTDGGGDGTGVAEATVMLGAAQTRLRRLQAVKDSPETARGKQRSDLNKSTADGKQLGKAQVRLMVRLQLKIEGVEHSVTDEWIDALFKRFDADNSGTMDDAEWESLMPVLKAEAAKIGTVDSA